MTSSNGNIFRVTGPLCGKFTGHQWMSVTKASEAELRCFFLSRAWINSWVNNHEPGDLRHHRAHYDIIVMTANALIPYVRRSAAATVATMQGKWDPFFHKKIILSFCVISVLTTDKNVIVCLCFLMKISATNFKTHDSTWMNIIILAWTSLWNLNPIAS